MDVFSPKLWPWMRFRPPDDKVVDFFLRAKITGNDDLVDFIPQAQSCKWEPWDLKIWLDSCGIKTTYPERWFFSPLDLKHRSGNRSNRATKDGYWKVTGRDKPIIMSGSRLIGKKKFLVFYKRRGKKGEKTDWVIHEYHITLKDLDGRRPGQNAFVLCRLSYKCKKSIKVPNISDAAGPAVSSPVASKLFHEDSESELLLASEFPASEVQVTTTPENCDGTIFVTTKAFECNDKHVSAQASENQLGELIPINDGLEVEKMIIELQQIVACNALKPSTSPHNNATVSSALTARSSLEELEELESTQRLDLVCPEEYLGRKTLNTIALSNCNPNSYNACPAKSEVPKATVNEFEEGLSLYDLPSEPPDCNLSSWLPPDMQFGMSNPAANDSNKSHCVTYIQYRANKPGAYGYEFSDATAFSLNECIPNTYGSQKKLALVSFKDNGSCSGSDAILANKPLEGCDPNSYNACAAKNEVQEAIASEFDLQFEEGLGMPDILPMPPDCNLASPFGMSCPITNDSNNNHCVMDLQFGVNDLAGFGHQFQDLKPDYLDEIFSDTIGIQNNLTLVSIKDTGSFGGPDAKLANAPFESTFQDSGEISKRKASSGLLNLESHMVRMGGSSNQIEGSDCILKN